MFILLAIWSSESWEGLKEVAGWATGNESKEPREVEQRGDQSLPHSVHGLAG